MGSFRSCESHLAMGLLTSTRGAPELRSTNSSRPNMSRVYGLSAAPGLASHLLPLSLTQETLVLIFAGSITKWNDPRIVATNRNFALLLPDRQIVPVSGIFLGLSLRIKGLLGRRNRSISTFEPRGGVG